WHNTSLSNTRTYCYLCPATYACNGTGLEAPTGLCAPGYYCKLGASTTTPYCLSGECDYGVCPIGKYCPLGTSDPVQCRAGTYMNHTGASECYLCPEGYYCDGTRPTSFEECSQGNYCPEGTDVSVPKCPAGMFSPSNSLLLLSQCTNCTAGSYCPTLGLTRPNGTCSEGYYCPSGSQDSHGKTSFASEHACPLGRYCVAGTGSPSLCPIGTYNPSEGVTAEEDCVSCSSGNYCQTMGLVAPTASCWAGYYCQRGVEEPAPTGGIYNLDSITYGGDICPSGTYCPNGTVSPYPCLAGSYNSLPGQGSCFSCPPGYFCQANATQYEDNPCPPGYYCPENTQYGEQNACPPGTYSNRTLTSSLSECVGAPAGWYVDVSASTELTGRCSEGYYCTGGSDTATPFCNETSDGTCGPCTAGEYCPQGSPYLQACPGGSYCADSSGKITGDCYEGYYCVQGSWTPAPNGEVGSEGSLVGDICPMGHYCPEGSITPRACPPGTYSSATGNINSTACVPCEPGYTCPFANTSIPTEECPVGFYCPAGEALMQVICWHSTIPCPYC
ncbi:unnamed protein product, partial [Choristocarpus tenellus]